jgi:hypothetical protein
MQREDKTNSKLSAAAAAGLSAGLTCHSVACEFSRQFPPQSHGRK